MGLFSCPHCNSDIDTNDKKSGHQVNDVIQETFCSVDCSIEYLVHNSQKIAVDGVWGAMEPKTNVSSESHRKGAFRSPAHPPGITL